MIYDADHYIIGYSATSIEFAIGFPLLVYCGYTCLQEFSLGSCSNMSKMCSPSPIRCFMAFSGRGWSCYRMVKSSNFGYSGVSRYCTCNAHLHNIWSGYSKVLVFYTKNAWKRLSQNSPQPGEYHRGRRHPRSGGVWGFLAETPRSGWLSQVSFCLVELMFLIDFEFFFFLNQLNQQKWGKYKPTRMGISENGTFVRNFHKSGRVVIQIMKHDEVLSTWVVGYRIHFFLFYFIESQFWRSRGLLIVF